MQEQESGSLLDPFARGGCLDPEQKGPVSGAALRRSDSPEYAEAVFCTSATLQRRADVGCRLRLPVKLRDSIRSGHPGTLRKLDFFQEARYFICGLSEIPGVDGDHHTVLGLRNRAVCLWRYWHTGIAAALSATGGQTQQHTYKEQYAEHSAHTVFQLLSSLYIAPCGTEICPQFRQSGRGAVAVRSARLEEHLRTVTSAQRIAVVHTPVLWLRFRPQEVL